MPSAYDVLLLRFLKEEGELPLDTTKRFMSQIQTQQEQDILTLLIKEGLITQQKLDAVIKKVESVILRCSKCKKNYTPKQTSEKAPLNCPVCDEPLVVSLPTKVNFENISSEQTEILQPTVPIQEQKGNPPSETENHDDPKGALETEKTILEKKKPAPIQEDPSALVGQEVDQYEVLDILGQGGMGIVYKARHKLLERNVALKILSSGIGSLGEIGERFLREAKVLASLNSSWIVQVHNMAKFRQSYYIEMEFVDGESLASKIGREAPFDVQETIRIIREICLGLKVAHDSGIIHRDIKPENILMSSKGEIKIADFGLARLSLGQGSLSKTGEVMGTPHYMSPEQAQGKPTDARSDIYSLGVMLYFMLSGKRPFSAETALAVLYRQVHESPVPIEKLQPKIPEDLINILNKMMAKDPKDRYPDISSIIEDIEKFQNKKSVTVEDPKPKKRKFLKVCLFLCFVLLLIFAGRQKVLKHTQVSSDEKKLDEVEKSCEQLEKDGNYIESMNTLLSCPNKLSKLNLSDKGNELLKDRLEDRIKKSLIEYQSYLTKLFNENKYDQVQQSIMQYPDALPEWCNNNEILSYFTQIKKAKEFQLRIQNLAKDFKSFIQDIDKHRLEIPTRYKKLKDIATDIFEIYGTSKDINIFSNYIKIVISKNLVKPLFKEAHEEFSKNSLLLYRKERIFFMLYKKVEVWEDEFTRRVISIPSKKD